jgi:GTPase SAR1 family protein
MERLLLYAKNKGLIAVKRKKTGKENLKILLNVMLNGFVFSCIFLGLDIWNIPSIILSKIGLRNFCAVTPVLVIALALIAIKTGWVKLLLNTYYLWPIMIGSIVFLIYHLVLLTCTRHICCTIAVVIIVVVVMLIRAMCKIFAGKLSNEEASKNTEIDLKIFLEEEQKVFCGPLMFSERDVDYDLLDREKFEKTIYESICVEHTEHCRAIGIVGEWGSGKTTIINRVKARLESRGDIAIIDEFDPWIYETQDALIKAFYSELQSKREGRLSKRKIRKIQDAIIKLILGHCGLNDAINTITDSSITENYSEIHNELEQCFSDIDKKIVCIIDNIDRTESDNIRLIFKLISSIFDISAITYVLVYDQERIEKVFEDYNKINERYIEKVIQQEIHIPQVSEKCNGDIIRGSVRKVLEYYGVTEREIGQYNSVARCVGDLTKNLRQLKRLFNTVFVSVFIDENKLYKPHLLEIEIIRFFKQELYNEIWENRDFYVIDASVFKKGQNEVSLEKSIELNDKDIKYFTEVVNKYPEYINALKCLFPRFHKYLLKGLAKNDFYISQDIIPAGYVQVISNADYFEAYFSYGSNEQIELLKSVDDYIAEINNTEIQDISLKTTKTLSGIQNIKKNEWFVLFNKKKDLITKEKWQAVAKAFCNAIIDYKRIRGVNRASLIVRVLAISYKMLKEDNKDVIRESIMSLSADYDIFLLESAAEECARLVREDEETYINLRAILNNKLNEICSCIVAEKVDIFEKGRYQRYQSFVLYRAVDRGVVTNVNMSDYYKYMSTIVNGDNVYRLLADCVSERVSHEYPEKYGYAFNIRDFDALLENEKQIDSLLGEPKTKEESIIKQCWELRTSNRNEIQLPYRYVDDAIDWDML